jgi:hypothetical protein
LKDNNFRKESYPFDWIFSDYDMIIDCLTNDFKNFLNKKYYTHVDLYGTLTKICGHKLYNEKMFLHHDPKLDDDYQYFERCVERFRKLLASDEKKLFIITIINSKYKIKPRAKRKILKINQLLNGLTKNFNILVMNGIKTRSLIETKILQKNNIYFVNFTVIKKSCGKKYILDSDTLKYKKIICNLFNLNHLTPIS